MEVVYDLRRLTTRALLREFFTLHDFEKVRDRKGGQYRSAIFTLRKEGAWSRVQCEEARAMVDRLRAAGYAPATEISTINAFYPAESRHQQYCSTRGITPKKREPAAVREILTFD